MNIMINNYCNLHCPYCFAQQEMTQHVVNNITQENFKKFLDFLKANDIKEVRMIGGEPTLHPHLFDLIQTVLGTNLHGHDTAVTGYSIYCAFLAIMALNGADYLRKLMGKIDVLNIKEKE